MFSRIKLNIPQLNKRNASIVSTFLKYTEYGEPLTVIKKYSEEINDPQGSQVLVKILASPINPADINTIEGKYPEKPKLPAVPGNECIAEVISCGPNVKQIKTGDRVITFKAQLGTWRTHAMFNETDVMRVPKELDLINASTLTVNPPTAFRMLKDFVDLKSGDTIIQNGSNSGVGQAVIQLCKIWNLNSVCVVRNRTDIKELVNFLKCLGATEVLTEEEIRTTTLFKEKKLPKPKLALNCVGGKSATEILRHLDSKGCMVTYGGMSREPVTAPTAALIFKDITFKGFWMTRWTKENAETDERKKMFQQLIEFMINGQIQPVVHKLIEFDDYQTALKCATNFKGFTGEKYILDFTKLNSKI